MSILSWNHTRKGTPMKQSGSYGSLMIRVMMVRSSYPNHPMFSKTLIPCATCETGTLNGHRPENVVY
jgi:hypothetical protein